MFKFNPNVVQVGFKTAFIKEETEKSARWKEVSKVEVYLNNFFAYKEPWINHSVPGGGQSSLSGDMKHCQLEKQFFIFSPFIPTRFPFLSENLRGIRLRLMNMSRMLCITGLAIGQKHQIMNEALKNIKVFKKFRFKHTSSLSNEFLLEKDSSTRCFILKELGEPTNTKQVTFQILIAGLKKMRKIN